MFIDFLCPFKKVNRAIDFSTPTLVQAHLLLRSEDNMVVEASNESETGARPGHFWGSP